MEIWKDIPEFVGRYQVSSVGRVRSLLTGTMLKQTGKKTKKGRLFVGLSPAGGGRARTRYVHQLVLEAFVCKKPDGLESRHIDGDKRNNRIENLCWGTHLQNEIDKTVHGTRPRGESHANHRLTVAQVEEIKLAKKFYGYKIRLARKYGVSVACIKSVLQARNWKWLNIQKEGA